MDFYVAKDCDRLGFFKDEPDLVRFSPVSTPIWEGYPVDFGDCLQIKNLAMHHPAVLAMDDYDPPVHLSIDDIIFSVL